MYNTFNLPQDVIRLIYAFCIDKRENWNKCDTAGALSRWILWNKTSRKGSENSFKKKFKLK